MLENIIDKSAIIGSIAFFSVVKNIIGINFNGKIINNIKFIFVFENVFIYAPAKKNIIENIAMTKYG